MNIYNRMLSFTLGISFAVLLSAEAAGQYVAAYPATTSVVAYQPVVVPTTPAAVSGWYPGKLLDTWMFNRATYRTAALGTVTTAMPVTSYQPVVASDPCTGCATTSYRPVTSVAYQTTYMPVRVFRPLFAQPLVATTAYSPIVSTSSAVCCDPCATATVAGYASATSACCTSSSADPYYPNVTTTQPGLGPDEGGGIPREAGRPPTDDDESNKDNSVLEKEKQPGETGGTDGASFEAPPLLRLEQTTEPEGDPTARLDRRAEFTPVLYREAAARSTKSTVQSKSNSKPSRAQRDAIWTAVTD